MNRDAFVCLVLYELVIILTVLLISVNLQFCLKLSVNFVDLSFLSRISFFFFTLFLGPVDKVKKKYLLYGKIYVIILP